FYLFSHAPATTAIYPLSLPRRSSDLDAAPPLEAGERRHRGAPWRRVSGCAPAAGRPACGTTSGATATAGSATGGSPRTARARPRSEEHTSELQSRENLVCRLLLEKKK